MKKLIISALLNIAIIPIAIAQDAIGITIELIYLQKADREIDLKATVTDDENSEGIKGLTLQYTAVVNGQTVVLGEATTNALGISELKGVDIQNIRKNGHKFLIVSSFAGNESFLKNKVSINISDASMVVLAETIDSVNLIRVSISTWNERGEVVPVEAEIKIYVPRMFSLLPIGYTTTEASGEGEFIFPTNIPGSLQGELAIVARVEENEAFGTLESSTKTNWGVESTVQVTKLPRALWSPDAPLWMVITFAILMTGVWYHYGFIIYKLVRIWLSSKDGDAINYKE